MHKVILLAVTFFIISCSSYDKDDYKVDQNIYLNNTLSDFELFELANNHISNNNLDTALIELDKIEVLFPSSKYANKSILLGAYIHFLKKDYEKTRAITENYKKYYPGSINVIYANYLEAMTYYVLIKKSDYSQKNAIKALEKFIFILNAYPNNKYEIDIITKIRVINNNLAQSKLKTAEYYIERDNTNGALVYLKDIYENHNSSTTIEKTLFLLAKIYFEIEEFEIAKSYASILAYNFPNSLWYRKTYNLINNLKEVEENETWFMRFNPVKIMNTKEEDMSEDTNIIILK